MRTIRVTGKGQIKVHPDMTRITITLEETYREYSDAMHHSAVDTEKLKDVLAPFGFERADLKALRFDVDTVFENYEERKVWKRRLIGYKYQHVLKVEFPSDNNRLGKILYALAHCSLKPEFRLSYFVKDPEASKNELLGKAVTDAREKAFVLAKAAGVALKEIQTVDYSWGQLNIEIEPMARGMALAEMAPQFDGASYEIDLEPDDIEISDTVTVIWEIG